ncbi:MAG: hypothetical protein AAF393_08050 [Pseudomonadota bacterium]
MGPQFEDHHFPSCVIPPPAQSETVTVVSLGSGPPYASVHVGLPTRKTSLVTLEILPSDKKHYIVLQSSGQIIWQFKGDTQSVSRVIVLGSIWFGGWAGGVVGLPMDRITHTTPDKPPLDSFLITSCTRIGRGCLASQWFGKGLSDRVTLYPQPSQGRFKADKFLNEGNFVRKSDWPVQLVKLAGVRDLVEVQPGDVIAPKGAAFYDQRPGQAGLDDLVASGTLISPGQPGFIKATDQWSEAFSARYRSRFDPDFTFSPNVDYVVTRQITLPAEIPPKTFLLAKSVPVPDMNGNADYRTCFLSLDQVTNTFLKQSQKSVLCREKVIGLRDHDGDVIKAASWFDKLQLGNNCLLARLPSAAKITVVSVLDEGKRRRKNAAPLEVEVNVSGDKPTVLFLQTTHGRAKWMITGAQIERVFMTRPPSFGQSQVVVNGQVTPHEKLDNPADGCPHFAPYDLHLGGPTFLHLDKMMETLLGQPIDQILQLKAPKEGRLVVAVD